MKSTRSMKYPLKNMRAVTRPFMVLLALIVFSLFAVQAASASASTQILYDQTTGAPGGFVPSESGVPSGTCHEQPTYNSDPQNCYAADDFTVPPGPAWFVQSVHVDGQGGTGDKFSWEVSTGEGLPAGVAGGTFYEEPLSGVNSFDVPFDFRYPFRGISLLPGHYWLMVSASARTGTPWSWQTQSPQAGYEAAWYDHPFNGTDVLKHLSEWGKTGPDLRFSLSGQLMDSAFGSFQLSKPERLPSGGVVALATIPGPGVITIHRLSGKGKIKTKVGYSGASKDKSEYFIPLKIKPAGKTKAALKLGKKFKMRLEITYTRGAPGGPLDVEPGTVPEPPSTKTLKVVLKKKGKGK